MVRSRKHRSHPRRVMLVAVAAVFCIVAGTAGVAGGRSLAERERVSTVYLDANSIRQKVRLIGPQTVTSVLIMAGVVPRDGRVLSAKSHRVLNPVLHPARLSVDGLDATAATPVLDGMTVTVTAGADEVEATTAASVAMPAPALPDVLRHVYRRGKPGMSRVVRGEQSGEVVSRSVIKKPVSPTRVPGKVVALTFDDGPTPQWTPAMLKVLASRGVKATFCEIGSNVGLHPEISRQVLAAGHQLCNHTLDHQENLGRAPHEQVEQQIVGGAAAQKNQGLPAPRYYRPAGGSLSPDVIATARSLREQVLYWKVDTEDWRTTATAEKILDNLKREVEPGAIILMHDGGGKSRALSVLMLGPVIDWLRSQGYQFVFPVIG